MITPLADGGMPRDTSWNPPSPRAAVDLESAWPQRQLAVLRTPPRSAGPTWIHWTPDPERELPQKFAVS